MEQDEELIVTLLMYVPERICNVLLSRVRNDVYQGIKNRICKGARVRPLLAVYEDLH